MTQGGTPERSPSGFGAIVSGSVVATVGVLPVFLLGGVAVLVREELGFSEAQLGIAVSVYWAVAALSSVPSGRVVELFGGRRSLVLAAATGGVALLGMSSAWSWWALLGWLVVGGMGNAMSQLAANLRLAGGVPKGRQGLAFGLKQSAIPGATMLAGAAVPAIALTLGWRWVFVGAAAIAAAVGGLEAYRMQEVRLRHAQRKARVALARLPLVTLAAAGLFGSATATAMAAFVVEYAVAVGVDPGRAGIVLAVGSLASITVRVLLGLQADFRQGGNLLLIAGMLAVGAIAVASFPLTTTWTALLGVTVVAFAVGWAWPGLFNFTVVRRNPQAPAAATAVTQAGVYVGGVLGPLTFGLLVSSTGYTAAWRVAALSLVVSAVLMIVGRTFGRRAWLGNQGAPTDR